MWQCLSATVLHARVEPENKGDTLEYLDLKYFQTLFHMQT